MEYVSFTHAERSALVEIRFDLESRKYTVRPPKN